MSTSTQENINKNKSSAYYPDTSEQPIGKLHSLTDSENIFYPIMQKLESHIQVRNLVQSSRLKIKQKMILLIIGNIQYQLVVLLANSNYLGETGRNIERII